MAAVSTKLRSDLVGPVRSDSPSIGVAGVDPTGPGRPASGLAGVPRRAAVELDGIVIDCRGLSARDEQPGLRGVKGEMILIETAEVQLARPVRLIHPRWPLYVIPREAFLNFCDERPGLWRAVSELLITRKRDLEKKIELLCLQDVEYRILYYLAELANVFGVKNGQEISVPLSQGELASLIGATRETTSTTLNTLARRGLIRLGRRQLILISLEDVLAAAKNRSVNAVAN